MRRFDVNIGNSSSDSEDLNDGREPWWVPGGSRHSIVFDCNEPFGPTVEARNASSVGEAFELFFSEELVQNLVYEKN